MAYTNKNEQKEFHRDWFKKNHERELAKIKARKAEIYTWYKDYKKTLTCTMCDYNGAENPRAISFHHLNDKYENVTELARRGCSKERILQEIDKCKIICENCHRKIHYKEIVSDNSLMDWYKNFRKELSCEECGEVDYRCIDLYRTQLSNKKYGFPLMIKTGYSFDKICKELSTCRALCANCHRKLQSQLVREAE